MEIKTKETKIKTNTGAKEVKFTIDAMHPEMMIKIVSDMYPNPRRTLITEYVQNADDSHREAGKGDVPIQVSLPKATDKDPMYRVRDFGIGMTREDMETIFSCVFKSTKNDTNDQLGGFGIGKLVFGAYSGVMYVNLYNGVEMTRYFVRLKDGFAGMTEQFCVPCAEPKGVGIEIPVKRDDIKYFHDVAVIQYGFMRTRPEVDEDPKFFDELDAYLSNKKLFETPDGKDKVYGLLEDLPVVIATHINRPQALIGGLPFDISLSTLASSMKNKPLIDLFSSTFFTMYFEPGEVDIVPSRDNLKYNAKTVRALEYRLELLKARAEAFVKTEVGAIKELAPLYRELVALKRSNVIPKSVCDDHGWGKKNTPLFRGALYAFLGNGGMASGGSYHSYSLYSSPNKDVSSNYNYSDREDKDVAYAFSQDEPELYELEKYMRKHVDLVRQVRRPRYSWRSHTETMHPCNDVRAKLLPIVSGFSYFLETEPNGNIKPKIRFLLVPDSMSKAEVGRKVNYKIAAQPDYTAPNIIIFYLDGVTPKEFVDKLVEANLGVLPEAFEDVSDDTLYPEPPVGARVTATSSGPSDTSFADNTTFHFDSTGSSPSNKFNKSYWLPAKQQEIKDLIKDSGTLVLYTPVSACKPMNENPPNRALNLEAWGILHSDSAVFVSILGFIRKYCVPKGISHIKIIGVKPSEDMTKHTGIKSLHKFIDDAIYTRLNEIKIAHKKLEDRPRLTEEAMAVLMDKGLKGVKSTVTKLSKKVPQVKTLWDICNDSVKILRGGARKNLLEELGPTSAHKDEVQGFLKRLVPFKPSPNTYFTSGWGSILHSPNKDVELYDFLQDIVPADLTTDEIINIEMHYSELGGAKAFSHIVEKVYAKAYPLNKKDQLQLTLVGTLQLPSNADKVKGIISSMFDDFLKNVKTYHDTIQGIYGEPLLTKLGAMGGWDILDAEYKLKVLEKLNKDIVYAMDREKVLWPQDTEHRLGNLCGLFLAYVSILALCAAAKEDISTKKAIDVSQGYRSYWHQPKGLSPEELMTKLILTYRLSEAGKSKALKSLKTKDLEALIAIAK